MKLCIFGSRGVHPSIDEIGHAICELQEIWPRQWPVLHRGPAITQIFSGGATGADAAGEQFAEKYGIRLVVMPADWKTHGKKAGPIRNGEMADACEAAIGFWDGRSRGTRDMIHKLEWRQRPHLVRSA